MAKSTKTTKSAPKAAKVAKAAPAKKTAKAAKPETPKAPEAPKAAPKAPKAPAKIERGDVLHESQILSPVKTVHAVCDQNKGKKRGEVLAILDSMGIAHYTARTQYQVWYKASKTGK